MANVAFPIIYIADKSFYLLSWLYCCQFLFLLQLRGRVVDFPVSAIAKMSFQFLLLMILLLCLCVVNAQEENYICGRNGGVPCWKRDEPEQNEIIEDTPEKFIHPLAKLNNKRSKSLTQSQRMLHGERTDE